MTLRLRLRMLNMYVSGFAQIEDVSVLVYELIALENDFPVFV